MRAAFEPRYHRFGHPEPIRELLLRFAALTAERRQLFGESRHDADRRVEICVPTRDGSLTAWRVWHHSNLAFLLCRRQVR